VNILSLEIGKSYQLCMARPVSVLDGTNFGNIAVSNISIFVVLRNVLISHPAVCEIPCMMLPLPKSMGICSPDQMVDVAAPSGIVDSFYQDHTGSSQIICCSCFCISLVNELPLKPGVVDHLSVGSVIASVVGLKVVSLSVCQVPISDVLLAVLGCT